MNNRYSLQGLNAVDITCATYGKFRVAYTLTHYGTRRAWFPRRGQYTAEWVSESPSAPRKARGL